MGFGKSKQNSTNNSQQTSESRNQAYPFIQQQLGDQVGNVGRSSNAIANLLGLNGASGQDEGFKNFRDSGGYNFIQGEGIKGIEGSMAARGLLGSGAALKGISNYSSGLASQYLDKYMSQLFGLNNSGLQSAQIISGAGNTANSQGTSTSTSRGSSTNFSLG
jgi:hypothetical protein